MRCLAILLLCGGLLCAEPSAQSVSLADLPEIARGRAERQRPSQEQALRPFWGDLSLDYARNSEYLDPRIREAAALGDSVVPLLLEKLDPVDGSDDTRQLADNCARVLALLDPSSFLDALVDLAIDSSAAARRHAIALLGKTRSPRAVAVLGKLLGELQSEADAVLALQALTALGDSGATAQAAILLGSGVEVRRAVLTYLNATGADSAVGEVQRALSVETEATLLRGYIDYLGLVVRDDASVAGSLVTLLQDEQLPREDQIALCEALATVAPQEHEATTESLRQILEAGHTGDLGRAAAVTLYKLGDRKGADILYSRLKAEARRSRNDPNAHSELAELHFSLGMWMEAISDYRQTAKLDRRRETNVWCHLRIARCEARLGRWKNVLTALRDSGAQRASILREAEQDPALKEALEQDVVARWLETLSR